MINTSNNNFSKELKRKAIHIFSTVIPILYLITSKEFIVIFVGIGTVFMILIDFLKSGNNIINRIYKKYLFDILRNDEKQFDKIKITGGTYYALGILLSLIFFTKEIAILSILVMIWCDTFAAIIGIYLGKHKIFNHKTFEGSISFLICGFVIVFILNHYFPESIAIKTGFVTVFVVTMIELYNTKFNDNIVLPLVTGFIYFLIFNFI